MGRVECRCCPDKGSYSLLFENSSVAFKSHIYPDKLPIAIPSDPMWPRLAFQFIEFGCRLPREYVKHAQIGQIRQGGNAIAFCNII